VASYAVILPAAGKSSRFNDPHYKKAFAPLDNRAVWMHSAEKFVNRDDVRQVVLVIAAEDREWFNMKFAANAAVLGIDVVLGGAERADSVANALAHIGPDVDFIAVHDAARPCIASEWIDRVFEAAEKSDAAILAIPVQGTLKRVNPDGSIAETVQRKDLWEAQTPQVFRRQLLLDAYAQRGNLAATDEAQLVEQTGQEVKIVQGSPINMKITTKADLRLAAQALKAMPKPKILGPMHPFADDDLWR
jgi:2-C-methyl-D-erythritol 4-phosphate cytidylyltransferase